MTTERCTADAYLVDSNNATSLRYIRDHNDPEGMKQLLMGKGFSPREDLLDGEFEVLVATLAQDYPDVFRAFLDGQIAHIRAFSKQPNWLQIAGADQEGQNEYDPALQPYFQTREGFADLASFFVWSSE